MDIDGLEQMDQNSLIRIPKDAHMDTTTGIFYTMVNCYQYNFGFHSAYFVFEKCLIQTVCTTSSTVPIPHPCYFEIFLLDITLKFLLMYVNVSFSVICL